jgi:alkyl sulfatase BDS1-like metallo-beta-lactamase superfamily hydrolase
MSLLEVSARLIDHNEPLVLTGLMSQSIGQMEQLADGLAHLDGFSNVVALNTNEGLVVFDTSHAMFAPRGIAMLRAWSTDPLHSAVYTHGHVDHVTGTPLYVSDAADSGRTLQVIGHESVSGRFDRYVDTAGYNGHVNMRQFRLPAPNWPTQYVHPTLTYRNELSMNIGGVDIVMHHARGETDDHTWAWVAQHRAVVCGDLFIWQFPNAGNPQKVQRYAIEWAVALRAMLRYEPELLLPAHGLPISGRDRIARVLGETARALEFLHHETLRLMNEGATLNDIIHSVRLPTDLAECAWLTPTYDEPEFVVRNIWRLYGGWYDGNPARLKPAPDATIAHEVADLAGGATVLAARAVEVADTDLALACQLIEWAVQAEPDSQVLHRHRADIYTRRRDAERSFMASGIYRSAALDSEANVAATTP